MIFLSLPVKFIVTLDYEPKVEFIGVVQCRDGEIKVVYTKKDETRAHVVSVKGKFFEFHMNFKNQT